MAARTTRTSVSSIPSMVKMVVHPRIPCFVKQDKLPVLDDQPNIVIPGELPEFLVIVFFAADQYRNESCVTFHYL